MSIMLASVAERRHEIGIRRAFGVRRPEILAQFAIGLASGVYPARLAAQVDAIEALRSALFTKPHPSAVRP